MLKSIYILFWKYKHRHGTFVNMSCSEERVCLECTYCGKSISYD